MEYGTYQTPYFGRLVQRYQLWHKELQFFRRKFGSKNEVFGSKRKDYVNCHPLLPIGGVLVAGIGGVVADGSRAVTAYFFYLITAKK